MREKLLRVNSFKSNDFLESVDIWILYPNLIQNF